MELEHRESFPKSPINYEDKQLGSWTLRFDSDQWMVWEWEMITGLELVTDFLTGGRQVRKDRMKGEQRLMNANEAAKYLGLSHWTLRELIWSGAIPLVQLLKKTGGRLCG